MIGAHMYNIEKLVVQANDLLAQTKDELRKLDAVELPPHIESDVADLLAMVNDAREQASHVLEAVFEYDDDANFDDFDKLYY